jgi:outer membrane lipoprotein-sorting protein
MRLSVKGFLAAACLAAAAAALAASAEDAPVKTADEVIGKYVAARGGLDKMKAIQSLEMKFKANQQGLEFPGKMDLKRPGRIRMEMTIQGKTMVQAYDGKTTWMIMPFLGSPDAQTMSADEAKEVIEQADLDGPLVDYKEKGHAVELLGKEDVEGSPAWKLKVALKNGDISYLYIDTETGLEVKETSKRKQQGSEVEVDSYLTNYKPVNGVLFPFAVENKVQGKSMGQFTVDEIAANVSIDDGIFAMPAPAPKPAPTDKDKDKSKPADKEKKVEKEKP